MKNLLFCISLFVSSLVAENYQISFNPSGASTSVDSVKVSNLTKATTVVLYGTDLLQLIGTSNLDLIVDNKPIELRISPNPSDGRCKVEFSTIEKSMALLTIFDLSGKTIIQTSKNLDSGNHNFEIEGLINGCYLLKINMNNQSFFSKIISQSDAIYPLKLSYIASVSHDEALKSSYISTANTYVTENYVDLQFTIGDILQYTAYSGIRETTSAFSPTNSLSVYFKFVDCVDADGNNYAAIKIGEQYWMSENLKTKHYNNGDSIATSFNDITQESNPKYQWAYNFDESKAMEYGRLYTFHTVYDVRNIAPVGWHVATDNEWTDLVNYLGGDLVAGSQLMENSTVHWPVSTNLFATNTTGFSALASGYRSANGVFYELNKNAYWWTATPANTLFAYIRSLHSAYNGWIPQDSYGKKIGFPVRCVKDE